MAARQFIYHMQGLSKTYPNGKRVLENINLSSYPDAKIGVLSVNGSSKSTLLRQGSATLRKSLSSTPSST